MSVVLPQKTDENDRSQRIMPIMNRYVSLLDGGTSPLCKSNAVGHIHIIQNHIHMRIRNSRVSKHLQCKVRVTLFEFHC